MAAQFKLSVVAPDRTVFDDMVQSVVAPGHEGYLGILAGHVPMIVALRAGVLEYIDSKGSKAYISVAGGFLEVSEGSVIVMADDAERATEIDEARAKEALEHARKALRGESSGMTTQEATREIDRQMARIRAARMN